MHLSQRMPPILAVVLHTHWPVTWSHMVTLPRAVPTGWQSQANKKYNIIEVGKSSWHSRRNHVSKQDSCYLDSHSLTAPSSQIYIECTQAPAHCSYTDDSDLHMYPLGSWYMLQSPRHTLYFCCYRNTEHSAQMVHYHSPRVCILENNIFFNKTTHYGRLAASRYIRFLWGREDWKLGGKRRPGCHGKGQNNPTWPVNRDGHEKSTIVQFYSAITRSDHLEENQPIKHKLWTVHW